MTLCHLSLEINAFQEISDYSEDICISDQALFPSHIWTSDSIFIQRTTNARESLHAKFNP